MSATSSRPDKRGSRRPTSEETDDAALESRLEVEVDQLIDAGTPPRMVFQPIVDLQRRQVVGYEALSRFDGPITASPDRWFSAADRIGRGNELEALTIEKALSARDELPRNCFLSINVSPEALLSKSVQALLRRDPLTRVVFELTEHSAVADYNRLALAIGNVRHLGGFIAVDDAGAGYSSLQHILSIRPDFVKLDRTLIAGLQIDEAKAALVEMFGGFTNRIDAWLLAEGIEQESELHRLMQLGVPLGQGFLLGYPGPMGQPANSSSPQPPASPSSSPEAVINFAEEAPTAPVSTDENTLLAILQEQPDRAGVVLLDPASRPTQLALPGWPFGVEHHPVTYVLDSTDIRQALRRAMTRPLARRFDPLVCTDESGNYRGVVLIERLVEELLNH